MGAGRRNKEEAKINTASGQIQQNYQNFMGVNTQDKNKSNAEGDAKNEEAAGGYRGFMDNGGVDANQQARMRAIFGGGPQSAESYAGYKNFSETGGISPEMLSNIYRQPLLDQEKTGGYSEGDIANIRRRSASAGSSIFGAANDQAARQAAITGQATGGAGLRANLARGAAQEANRANLDSSVGLHESIRSGKMDASKTLAGLGVNVADLTTRNKAEGLRGLTGLDQFYKSGQAGTENNIASMVQSGKQFGTAGMAGMAENSKNRALSQSGMNLQALQGMSQAQLAAMGLHLQNDATNKRFNPLSMIAGGIGSYYGAQQ